MHFFPISRKWLPVGLKFVIYSFFKINKFVFGTPRKGHAWDKNKILCIFLFCWCCRMRLLLEGKKVEKTPERRVIIPGKIKNQKREIVFPLSCSFMKSRS